MRIKSLRFRNVGPFGAEGVKLDGFTTGLNVVCKTNEFGKSTVLKALELLWVRQGKSMESISDNGQIASRLEGELGTLIGGERARDYLTRVELELADVLTKTGQEKKGGPLRQAREAVEATQIELSEAIRLRDLTTTIGLDLNRVQLDIERLSGETQDESLTAEIEITRKDMIAARSFADALALLCAHDGRPCRARHNVYRFYKLICNICARVWTSSKHWKPSRRN